MKKRIFNVLNFLALNVLFFAIYLNFIHKDINVLPPASTTVPEKNMAAAALKNPMAATKQKQKWNAAEN